MSWVKTYGRCICLPTTKGRNNPINNMGCPPMFKKVLTDLLDLVTISKSTVDRFFPASRLFAPFMSAMEATVNVSPALFTRIAWANQNKPAKFDSTSAIHIYQLKDIYAQYGYDWTTDPVLNPQ